LFGEVTKQVVAMKATLQQIAFSVLGLILLSGMEGALGYGGLTAGIDCKLLMNQYQSWREKRS